jgi:hypothetical protein
MGPRVEGRRRRVALAAGLLVAFVGCSEGPTVDPTTKAEPAKTADVPVAKTPATRAVKKLDPAPNQRKSAGRE